jgi:hypothetical protein
MNLLDAPFFVAAPVDESASIGPLGLGSVNLALTDKALPGINNVVKMVRPYSLMCWVCKRFEDWVKETGRDAHPVEFKRFKEKVETAFTLSHAMAGVKEGMLGVEQTDPGGDPVDLQFVHFERQGSFLDAVQYGPSLKNQSGLGFLFLEQGFHKVRPPGAELAAALDKQLRALTPACYAFIASIERTQAPRAFVGELYSAWAVDKPSPEECATFAAAYYPEYSLAKKAGDAARARTLNLVLETLRTARAPMNVEQVRRRLACEPLPATLAARADAERFERARKTWQVLQVRQAQRLGLEALFGWAERRLLDGETSIEALAGIASAEVRKAAQADEIVVDEGFVTKRYARFRQADAAADALLSSQAGDDGMFAAMEAIERSNDTMLPWHAFNLLLQSAAMADAFERDKAARELASDAPQVRVPLRAWGQYVQGQLSLPLPEFMHWVLTAYVLNQHWQTAIMRSRADGRSRLRVSSGDERGLTSLLSSARQALRAGRTPDRLLTAMALMASCGLLDALPSAGKAVPPRLTTETTLFKPAAPPVHTD